MQPDRVAVETRGPVTLVRMTHGENRLHPELLTALNASLDQIQAASGDAALVLTGTGKFFSNGLDLDHMSAHPAEAERTLASIHALFGRLLGMGVPTVVAINGHAFAAGAMLALTVDEAVMRADRGFFCLPEADLGFPFTPGMNALITSRLAPPVAHQAMVTAHRYNAESALAAGIVTELASEDDLLDRALARAEALAAKPRHAIATIKRGLYGATIDLLSEATR